MSDSRWSRRRAVSSSAPSTPRRPASRLTPAKPMDGGRSSTRDNDTVVDFTVQVPAGIGLVARTVNGSVDADGLRSDTDASTVNGSVNVTTTGTARASTVNGSIRAEMGQAAWSNGAKFSTVNGDVTLRMPAAV